VEPSNLSRQFYYPRDIGDYKAVAFIRNLQQLCTSPTRLYGFAMTFAEAVERDMDLSCNLAVCGVDNNPARVAVSRYCRFAGIPVVFLAVSADADHGYVFIQEKHGPCISCLFPDMVAEAVCRVRARLRLLMCCKWSGPWPSMQSTACSWAGSAPGTTGRFHCLTAALMAAL